MKRAATHLLAKILLFFRNYRAFSLIKDPPGGQTPGQDKGAKTRPQGQLECANPRGSPGGGWSGLELTGALSKNGVACR